MVEVTKIEICETGRKRYLLFYSVSQFASWLVTVLSVEVILNALIAAFHMPRASIQSIAVGVLCALPSVFLARPARFSVTGSWRVQAAVALKEQLNASKFKRTTVSEIESRYVQNLPKFLRWEKSHVTILEQRGTVLITGPYGALLGLRRFIVANFVKE